MCGPEVEAHLWVHNTLFILYMGLGHVFVLNEYLGVKALESRYLLYQFSLMYLLSLMYYV